MRPDPKALLREPIVHFLVLGAALFAAYGALNPNDGVKPAAIVVSQGQVEHLALGFARTWQRPPSGEELQALIRDHVREEVYYREAIALGLDRDDIVIRRRLRQKLEFVSEDIAALTEPTQDDLQALLRAQPERFRTEPRFTFRHVYLNPQQRGERLAADADALLGRLRSADARDEVTALGDRFLLDSEFEAVAAGEIAGQFGAEFARSLQNVVPNSWQGPVQSGYGAHLVFVSSRTQRRVPSLEEIRDVVREEWTNVQREKATEAFYQKLLSRYQVRVEQPKDEQAQGIARR